MVDPSHGVELAECLYVLRDNVEVSRGNESRNLAKMVYGEMKKGSKQWW